MKNQKGIHELFNETIETLIEELELMQEVGNEYHDRRIKEEKRVTLSVTDEMVKNADLEMLKSMEKEFYIKLVQTEAKIEVVKDLMEKMKVKQC